MQSDIGQENQEREGSLEDLVNFVFDRDLPLARKSVQLGIENLGDIKDMFEFMLQLFTFGMRKKFGNKVDLDKISYEQITDFKHYFEAIGVTFNVKRFHPYQIEQMWLNHFKNSNQQLVNSFYKFDVRLDTASAVEENRITSGEFDKISHLYPDIPQIKYIRKYNTIDSRNIVDYYFQIQTNSGEKNYYVINFDFISE